MSNSLHRVRRKLKRGARRVAMVPQYNRAESRFYAAVRQGMNLRYDYVHASNTRSGGTWPYYVAADAMLTYVTRGQGFLPRSPYGLKRHEGPKLRGIVIEALSRDLHNLVHPEDLDEAHKRLSRL